MDVTNLERLAALRIEERRIKALIEEALEEVTNDLKKKELPDGTQLEVATGVFTVSYRKSWKYPDALVQKEEQIKDEKKEAQQTGKATYTETPSLIFKETVA